MGSTFSVAPTISVQSIIGATVEPIQTQSTTINVISTATLGISAIPTATANATASENYTLKYQQMRGAINVLADILMYISFFVTAGDCAYTLYTFKYTQEKILDSSFKLLLLLLQLFGIFYRKNVVQTTGTIVFIVWLAGILSLWHEFKWFTFAFPIWIAFVVLLDNISMIYISGRIFTVTVQLNWYNDVFIQKTKKIYYISQAFILLILFIDGVGIVCYSYSYAIEKADQAFNSFDLIAMAFYCTPLHYILVWTFFNQTIELGYGDINLTLSTAPSVLVFDRKEEPASFGVQGRYI
ncbi:hypothetical protein HDV04_000596 [Boothiomyces sp. JEL0838]|nr:hypothetical protein HDV04_000596 [Boothiomyces sp. JEL0838]